MKLIIQIPCLNEEQTLPRTLADIPRVIEGVDVVELLVVDDGSTDRTAQIAREHGVHHVVQHHCNKGLAQAFHTGIHAALERGADIIVNTDADNQYPGHYIPELIRPIVENRADMVIGNRQTDQIAHFSPTKKLLQKLGSRAVRSVSGTDVPDAPSGFRALSREAALRLNLFTHYTYTLETIIQAGKKNMTIVAIPITTNGNLRDSRLVKSTWNYVLRSLVTILRLFVLYEPFRTFLYFSIPFFSVGLILWLRFFYFLLTDQASRGSHVQSVIVGAVLIIIGFLIFLIGLVGELIAINRRLHEETLYYLKSQMYDHEPEAKA